MGQLSRSDLGNPKHAAMLGHICSYETGCIWQREKEKQCKHMSISSRLACSISQMLHQWAYSRGNKHIAHRVSNNIPESASNRIDSVTMYPHLSREREVNHERKRLMNAAEGSKGPTP